MAKGYWIAHVKIRDPQAYPAYVAAAKPAFEKYGARFLARGGDHASMEGDLGERHVVIEFETKQQALDCYNSPEYQIAAKIRQSCADGHLVIVEGL
ncbi:DUF1330 domain-containing protein [Polymorphum gilvum]|uniref:Hypothetical conserved protein n=1 Tax=Polymorphum gilvum (strain LMG 25793 / CGMCC 1.9160 / SL003B-26A1) TaxID=991905 RepID=F2IYD7_POLGS|nr:DUF1330 domain-containing protein [Polymorphum gilvum]ADZ68450.1 Hypothetical conserved protein [Polymorphum gilvum SL003B-26A1]